jgi:hypothetical protein
MLSKVAVAASDDSRGHVGAPDVIDVDHGRGSERTEICDAERERDQRRYA